MNDSQSIMTEHGVFIDMFDAGIMLCGQSGIGKSELALGLINRGHRLVADDSVEFTKKGNALIGCCPALLQDFLEVRGLGILNIRNMFGSNAIQSHKALALIINIVQLNQQQLTEIDRLAGMHGSHSLLGIDIPSVSIPVSAGRNLAIIAEAAVKNHQLIGTGYNASDDFARRHAKCMGRNHYDQ